MKTKDFVKENFVIDAHEAHQDHEVQMARSQCYNAAQAAIELHKLLKNISEQQGIEGWVAAKITMAADYLDTVRDYLKYESVDGLHENTSSAVATVPATGKGPNVGTLFGGGYKPQTPFTKKAKKTK
jgi:hypothetical protein